MNTMKQIWANKGHIFAGAVLGTAWTLIVFQIVMIGYYIGAC